MGFDAVIFDLDGTLVYTTPEFRYEIVSKTLREHNRTALPDSIDRFWYGTNRNSIILEEFDLEADAFWNSFKQFDTIELRRQHVRLYSDVDMLNRLNGTKRGVLTGAPLHITALYLEILGISFDSVVVARPRENIKEKPHPMGLEKCMSELMVPKNKTLYVGNAEEDVLTGKNAGVATGLIERGEIDTSHFEPTFRLQSLYDLEKQL